jgi:hypothetical protein
MIISCANDSRAEAVSLEVGNAKIGILINGN